MPRETNLSHHVLFAKSHPPSIAHVILIRPIVLRNINWNIGKRVIGKIMKTLSPKSNRRLSRMLGRQMTMKRARMKAKAKERAKFQKTAERKNKEYS